MRILTYRYYSGPVVFGIDYAVILVSTRDLCNMAEHCKPTRMQLS